MMDVRQLTINKSIKP